MAGSQDSRSATRILPPSVTGMPTTADFAAAPVGRRDRVYASTELRVARVYAALAPFRGRGDVYEVALEDPIEPDGIESGVGGDSVCAPSAIVIRIVECHVDLHVASQEIAAEILRLRGADGRGFGGCRALSGLVRPLQASPASLPADRLSGADRATLQR
jgi:hypothetical protein